MPIQTKADVLRAIESRYKVSFTPVKGKRVFFDTSINGVKTIIVCSPHSTTHKSGQGWIDLTRIQIDLMDRYDAAILAFRLPRQQTYFIDFKQLRTLLTENCIFVNNREGEHWKLYVWPERIEVRQNEIALLMAPNTFENIDPIFSA